MPSKFKYYCSAFEFKRDNRRTSPVNSQVWTTGGSEQHWNVPVNWVEVYSQLLVSPWGGKFSRTNIFETTYVAIYIIASGTAREFSPREAPIGNRRRHDYLIPSTEWTCWSMPLWQLGPPILPFSQHHDVLSLSWFYKYLWMKWPLCELRGFISRLQ